VMRSEDLMRMVLVGIFAAMIIFALSGCKTVNGLKEDVYDARKSVSDFVLPSEPPVKEEKKVD
jgi:predicted small secreted protein